MHLEQDFDTTLHVLLTELQRLLQTLVVMLSSVSSTVETASVQLQKQSAVSLRGAHLSFLISWLF